MKRAIVIVTGKVQKVRYRSKVGEIADALGIVGEAENLDDGSIRIVAEGEAENLDAFIAKIKIKNYLMTEKLDNYHYDTIQRFENLDTKYGRIAEERERIFEELKEERKEYRETVERLVNAIIESGKERRER